MISMLSHARLHHRDNAFIVSFGDVTTNPTGLLPAPRGAGPVLGSGTLEQYPEQE